VVLVVVLIVKVEELQQIVVDNLEFQGKDFLEDHVLVVPQEEKVGVEVELDKQEIVQQIHTLLFPQHLLLHAHHPMVEMD
jgi:hypothetical protein